jgi:hypothetical protein
MGAKIQAFDIFQTPLGPHYPLPLSYIYLDFLTTSFLFLVVTLALKQNPRPHSAFRALLPSANYSAE